jgi:hypothetical protein
LQILSLCEMRHEGVMTRAREPVARWATVDFIIDGFAGEGASSDFSPHRD